MAFFDRVIVESGSFFAVIGISDLKAMIKREEQRLRSSCEITECAAEIGDALGARLVVKGQVGKVGDA